MRWRISVRNVCSSAPRRRWISRSRRPASTGKSISAYCARPRSIREWMSCSRARPPRRRGREPPPPAPRGSGSPRGSRCPRAGVRADRTPPAPGPPRSAPSRASPRVDRRFDRRGRVGQGPGVRHRLLEAAEDAQRVDAEVAAAHLALRIVRGSSPPRSATASSPAAASVDRRHRRWRVPKPRQAPWRRSAPAPPRPGARARSALARWRSAAGWRIAPQSSRSKKSRARFPSPCTSAR